MSRPRTELTAYAGISGSILAVALVLGARPWLALAGALLLACVPAGAAVMCWVDSGDAVQAGLTLVLSLAVPRSPAPHDLAGGLASPRPARPGRGGRPVLRRAAGAWGTSR